MSRCSSERGCALVDSQMPLHRRQALAERRIAVFEIAIFSNLCYNRGVSAFYAPTEMVRSASIQKEFVMGKGNNSQKNDKKSKKPKADKKAAPATKK